MSGQVIAGRFGAEPAPEGLSTAAAAVWKRLVPSLARAGIVKETDLAGLALLCELEAEVEVRFAAGKMPDLGLLAELRRWHDRFLMSPMARAKAASYGWRPDGAV